MSFDRLASKRSALRILLSVFTLFAVVLISLGSWHFLSFKKELKTTSGSAAEIALIVSRDKEALRRLLELPEHFPLPLLNVSEASFGVKVELGKKLFFDQRLSANETQSCNSCHVQSFAFSDGIKLSKGSRGDSLKRNTQPLFNLAYYPTLTWANPYIDSLEKHVRIPLLGFDPVEMGINERNRDDVLARFSTNEEYALLFKKAFPELDGEITIKTISNALASFLSTLISANTPYDRYLAGDKNALSQQQLHGLELFNSTRLGCTQCHAGINLTIAYSDQNISPLLESIFINTGLYNVEDNGGYPEGNQGLYEVTLDPLHRGKFRVPTLRNVEYTAPYMHDGSVATLSEVLDHYARGGRKIVSGNNAGDGRLNPLKSPLIKGFELSNEDKGAVIAFLLAFSDRQFAGRKKQQKQQDRHPPKEKT